MSLDSVWDSEVEDEQFSTFDEDVEEELDEYEELCPECDGSGEQHDMMDYDDEESWAGVCMACNGTGKASSD